MYVATASPQPKRTAFDGLRGGNVPCVPPPWIRHCCEGELLKDNLIPYTSEYTQLGYVYQVDMEGHDSTGWTLGRILAMETCRPN